MLIDELETFLAVARTENMAEAAREVWVSQGTASTRIKNLEEELGTTLFVRARGVKGVALTPAGERLLPIAREQVALWRRAADVAGSNIRTTLHVVAADRLNADVLVRAYRSVVETHPEVFLDVRTDHTREAYQMLETGQADVGFVFRLHRSDRENSRPLFRERWGVVCPADHGFVTSKDPHELDPTREVTRTWGAEFDQWHRLTFSEGEEAIRVGSLAMLPHIIALDDVWSVVPAGVGHACVKENPSLVFVPLKESQPPAPVAHVLTPHRSLPWVADVVATLMDAVTAVIEADPDLTAL